MMQSIQLQTFVLRISNILFLLNPHTYRARSAFKLLELDNKFRILKPGHIVLDLGGAPGSWTQVVVKKINSDGKRKYRFHERPQSKYDYVYKIESFYYDDMLLKLVLCL